MNSKVLGKKIGPIVLAEGISTFNFVTFLYASFIAIGLLTGMSFLQAYILQEHLGIPRSQQGSITGLLGLTVTEGPVTFGDGKTSVFVRDPDRNVIEFTQLQGVKHEQEQ